MSHTLGRGERGGGSLPPALALANNPAAVKVSFPKRWCIHQWRNKPALAKRRGAATRNSTSINDGNMYGWLRELCRAAVCCQPLTDLNQLQSLLSFVKPLISLESMSQWFTKMASQIKRLMKPLSPIICEYSQHALIVLWCYSSDFHVLLYKPALFVIYICPFFLLLPMKGAS